MFFLFDVNNTIFTIPWLNYSMSCPEFIATILGFWCVVETTRIRLINWPIGILNTLIFTVMFYQLRLYCDMFLNGYFFFIQIYGWYKWSHPVQLEHGEERLPITSLTFRSKVLCYLLIVISVALLGFFMSHIHELLPAVLPNRAAYPYWDAASTVLAIGAQFFMARKVMETWTLWIVADAIYVVLYIYKDIYFVSLQCAIFLLLAIYGWYAWHRKRKQQENPA